MDIKQELLNGNVQFTGYLVASEQIENFSPNSMNEEYYGDTKFIINPGDILGVSNTLSEFIDPKFKNHDNRKLKPIIKIVGDKKFQKDYYKID